MNDLIYIAKVVGSLLGGGAFLLLILDQLTKANARTRKMNERETR